MSLTRFTAASVLALSLAAGTATAGQITTTTNNLNLRSGPGTQYSRILVIPAGAQADVVSCGGRWCIVNFAGIMGYVDGNYLLSAVTVVVSPLAGLQLQ
jgi:uncharacterized protein YraI